MLELEDHWFDFQEAIVEASGACKVPLEPYNPELGDPAVVAVLVFVEFVVAEGTNSGTDARRDIMDDLFARLRLGDDDDDDAFDGDNDEEEDTLSPLAAAAAKKAAAAVFTSAVSSLSCFFSFSVIESESLDAS